MTINKNRMLNVIRMFCINGINKYPTIAFATSSHKRNYATNPRDTIKKDKKIHPYRKIHPWRSVESFSESIIAGIIHNEDGLVAINKPYGISGKSAKHETPSTTGIVNDVSYSLDDAIPSIAKALGYSSLELVKSPEKFTSGIAILAASDKVKHAVEKSLRRAQGMSLVPAAYWAVTTRVPNEIKGEKRLAMKMKEGPNRRSLPIIIESWYRNEQKRQDIKILNVQFKIISNSVDNLSSLMEIKSSTKKWHALRLFASTVLYSPILGDNLYGSRIQNVMGKWMNVSPFVEAAQLPPRLNKDLLNILKITSGKEQTIPVHLHLREYYLPMYGNNKSDLVLIAPPMPEFEWTCRQLKFKHELFQEKEENYSEHSTFEAVV